MMVLDGLGASETGQQASQLTSAGQTRHHGHVPARARHVRAVRGPRPACSSPATTDWAGSPRPVGCRWATSATPTRPPAPSRVIDGVRYSRAGRPGPAARGRHRSSCSGATRSPSTPAARRSSPRRSSRRCCATRRWPTASWPGARRSAGARRSSRSCSSPTASRPADADLREEAARHIARYKLPKAIVRVDAGPAGAVGQGRLPLGPGGRREAERAAGAGDAQRIAANAARTSSTNDAGCSRAAKCPPRSGSAK